SLRRYVSKHHGSALGALSGAVLRAGAASRYVAALVTPGEKGRRRRARYRAALGLRAGAGTGPDHAPRAPLPPLR
ncbi:MAG TPA: hypothetical protein VOA00_07625, partial [Thermoanaerobaculia bacterium]|nr:hypothetical protein [Thermoanaerobaculia bacterium]